MQVSQKHVRLASALIALLAVLVTLTPGKVDDKIVAVLSKLLVFMNKTAV